MNDFWKERNVLVTGHEGFLGSNMTKRLLSYEAKVIGLDIWTNRKWTILRKKDLNEIEVIRGDVANYKLLKQIFDKYNVEFVFHLAAEAIVGKCLKYPRKAFSSNIQGTWNILEVCRNNSTIRGIVIASSDKAYGIKNKLPYKESDSLAGSHPYDVSKSCGDLLAYTYFRTYNLPVCVTRCGNIYGPGDFNFSRIVPDTIRSALENKPLIIRSDGNFTRDYIYVDDVVVAYLLLAEKIGELKLFGEAFNFSDETPISVLNLVKSIYKIVGKSPNYKILNQAEYEIPHQYLSAKKAKKILNWKPGYKLEEGLKKTIQWYKKVSRQI